MTKTIEVEIYSQRYVLTGDAEEDYVKRVARSGAEAIRRVSDGMKTATLSRLAVLAAINIAHELFQAEQRREQNEAEVERRAVCLMESIEEQLEPVRKR